MIRVGIIGLGFGEKVHLPAFLSHPKCKVVAICGTPSSQNKLKKIALDHQIEKTFTHWHELIKDSQIDAVSIATPPSVQSHILSALLTQNKHLFLEKPLSAGELLGQKLLQHYKKNNLMHMIDFEMRAIPSWIKAKEFFSRQTLGKNIQFNLNWQLQTFTNKNQLESWKTSTDSGGGALFSFASHVFDYLEWFFGDILSLSSSFDNNNVYLWLKFKNETFGTISIGTNSHLGSGFTLEAYGEQGSLILENKSKNFIRDFTLKVALIENNFYKTESDSTQDALPFLSHEDERLPAVKVLINRFIESIESKKLSTPNISQGIRVDKLIECAKLSNTMKCFIPVTDDFPKALKNARPNQYDTI